MCGGQASPFGNATFTKSFQRYEFSHLLNHDLTGPPNLLHRPSSSVQSMRVREKDKGKRRNTTGKKKEKIGKVGKGAA